MAHSNRFDKEELMAFLLGELEEAETTEIESRFLNDSAFELELEEAEKQLFENYQSGALGPVRSGRFEKRFLTNSLKDEKREYETLLAKNELAREPSSEDTLGKAKDEPATSSASSQVGSGNLESAPSGGKSFGLYVILVILLVAGGVGYLVLGRSSPSALDKVALPGFSVRGQSQVVGVPRGTSFLVEFQGVALGYQRYSANILGPGKTVQALQVERKGETISAKLDAAKLQPGRNDIELLGVNGDETPTSLGFFSMRK